MREALAGDARPFLISDSGDNPTAGGAGDVSWTLNELLGVEELRLAKATAIYASIWATTAYAARCSRSTPTCPTRT